jgi:hypothetical protein
MLAARNNHTATLLANGKVLVAGGRGSSGILNEAELYDPIADSWSSTGSLATARDDHTATLLQNNSVLVAGGLGGGPPTMILGSAELYLQPPPTTVPALPAAAVGSLGMVLLASAARRLRNARPRNDQN